MNKLELCNMLAREAGVSGGNTAFTTVVGVTGELDRLVGYIDNAWEEVQNAHMDAGDNWRWMRVGFTLQTVAAQDAYAFGAAIDDLTTAAITRFRKWMIQDEDDPPKIFLTSGGVSGQGWMSFIVWNDFKFLYKIGTQVDSQPYHITVDPQNNLVLGPQPGDIYTVSGDYLRSAQTLPLDTDIPEMPVDFHKLIVWKALVAYGLFESAPECITKGEHYATTYMGDLENDQLSRIGVQGPMA